MVNYTYAISYYISNSDPNNEEDMKVEINLDTIRLDKFVISHGSSKADVIRYDSKSSFQKACIKVENGKNFFDKYSGEGICTQIKSMSLR